MTKKVLIVEDNELNLRLFSDLLRAHSAAVDPVRDARDALRRMIAFQPDLVVMDIQLPHISGLDLIRRMKLDQALAAIPIMAVTAYAGKGDEDRVREAGADSYVSKPMSVNKFISSVEALIGSLGDPLKTAASA